MPEYIVTGLLSLLVAVIELVAAKDRKKAREERQAAEKRAAVEAKAAAEREKSREKIMVQLIQCCNASIALGEATARAVQRIPDAHCNGDMKGALDYATRVKHALRQELTEEGVHAIWE